MKRFYKITSVIGDDERGFQVQLDGKSVKTPLGHDLLCPTQPLAEAIAAEWQAQGEDIVPDSMPLMQILATSIDRIPAQRDTITDSVLSYIDTDLICYRTRLPEELSLKQEEIWDPWLKWFEKNYQVMLETTYDLNALSQPQKAHDLIQKKIESLTAIEFTILQILTPLTGSVVLSLAFLEGSATAEDVYNAAFVEELYKAALYNEAVHGGDPHQEKKQNAMKRDLEAARRCLTMIP